MQYEKEVDDLNFTKSFKNQAKSILNKCKINVKNIEGQYDNTQYLPELENPKVNVMKLFPCWSTIVISIFNENEVTVSNARVESYCNQLKNRLFKSKSMPV